MQSSIVELLTIGDDVIVGMGSAVFRDVPAGNTVVGVSEPIEFDATRGQWLWDEIANSQREHFSLAEIKAFYGQYGYRVMQEALNFSLPNSIFIFGHQHTTGMHLKHAGRTDDFGFYISKLGAAGSVLWVSPQSDECPEYGRPLVQLVRHT